MKAVVAREPLPVSDPRALLDEDVPEPSAPTGRDLLVRVRALGLDGADHILNCAELDRYWLDMAEAVRPQGSLCSIVANEGPIDLKAIQRKCATFAFEAMFTRSSLQLPDMEEQRRLLDRVAAWVDAGKIRSTLTEHLSPISAATLRKAHERLESRRTIGKIVLSGW